MQGTDKKEDRYFSRPLIQWASTVLFLLLLPACAASPEKKADIIWPLPPETPRIKFVKTIESAEEVEKQSVGKSVLSFLVGPDPTAHFQKPYGVHYDGQDRLFVADSAWKKILMLDYKKKDFRILGVDGPGVLTKPMGVTTDASGHIYVSDTYGARVVVFDSDGNFLLAMGGKQVLEEPVGIAVNDQLRRIYVVDTRKHNVTVFDFDGKFLFAIGGRGLEDGEFNYPTNIAVGPGGKIYVMDTMNFRVQIFDSDGHFLSKFGSIGKGFGQFSKPKGIGVDSEGHIYVADAAFNNIQIFDEQGQLLLFFGEFGTHEGQLYLPAGLWIDKRDRIYVADQYNKRIEVFQYLKETGKAEAKSVEGKN